MAKMQKINMMKKNTRIKPGIDARSDPICCLIVGILLIDLRGLRIRKVLRALSPELDDPIGRKPMTLIHTMKKSRQFQGSHK
jgi:hypothetical protein